MARWNRLIIISYLFHKTFKLLRQRVLWHSSVIKTKTKSLSRESTDLRRLWKVYLMGTWGGVAYHLDEQAGRSTVWANGTQIKIQDWSILFRVAFTISTNQFHLPKNDCQGLKPRKSPILSCWNWYQRWLWRNGTRISVCNAPFGKIGLSFQMFRNVYAERPKKSCPIYFLSGFSGNSL